MTLCLWGSTRDQVVENVLNLRICFLFICVVVIVCEGAQEIG